MEDKLISLKKDMNNRVFRNMKVTRELEHRVIQSIAEHKYVVVKPSRFKELLSIAVLLMMIITGIQVSLFHAGSSSNLSDETVHISAPFLSKMRDLSKKQDLAEEIYILQQTEKSITIEMAVNENTASKKYKKDATMLVKNFSKLYRDLHPLEPELWTRKEITIYISHNTANRKPLEPCQCILTGYKSSGAKHFKWTPFSKSKGVNSLHKSERSE